MGSFSELVLSFGFRTETPEEVLAAFAALEQPIPEDVWWGPAPPLPVPVAELDEDWVPDWRAMGSHDELEAEPWRHNWAPWLSQSMRVATAPSAALLWMPAEQRQLTRRCSFKVDARSIFESGCTSGGSCWRTSTRWHARIRIPSDRRGRGEPFRPVTPAASARQGQVG